MADNFLQEVALVPNETYNYSNSSVFYSLVNTSFLKYYQTVVKKSQEWLDGYDPAFHKNTNGILSTRIGAKITAGITKQIFGRGIIFVKGKNTTETKALNFISHEWQDQVKFQNFVKTIIGYTTPLGTSLGKVNVKWKWNNKEHRKEQHLWVQALRMDYFYYTVNSENELQEVTCFIRAIQTTQSQEYNYVLCEKRYFRDDFETIEQKLNGKLIRFKDKTHNIKVPVAKYCVYRVNAQSDNNSLAANKGAGINYKSLPADVKNILKDEYGALKLDEEIVLPFKDSLGCVLFFNEGGDFTHPNMPFGRALMFDCIADFMEYDMAKSYSIRDLYQSKGVVGLPKALSQASLTGASYNKQGAMPGQPVDFTAGNAIHDSSANASPYGRMNIPGYTLLDGVDPEKQQPIINQFEMRAAEHETKQNAILKSIATTIGMSPRVIASYLVQGNEKTAEQTHSEDDTITEWIKSHRQDYTSGLNEIIELVLSFYGYTENVECKFASDGLVSNERQIEIIKSKLELGIIDLEDAVREVYPDLDEEQIQDKINRAKKQQELNQQQEQNQFDEMYGDELDGNQENEFNEQ